MRRVRLSMMVAVVLMAGLSTTCAQQELILPARRKAKEDIGTAPRASSGAQVPARVFVIQSPSDLLSGPTADGRVGDFRIDNGRVAFIVDAVTASFGFADSGGNLVDAAPIGGKDFIKQIFGYLDDTFPRQPLYSKAELARRQEAAVLRVIGVDSQDPRIRITTEYALEPGAIALEITTTVENGTDETISKYEIGDAIQWGRCSKFAPGLGFNITRRPEVAAGWIAGICDTTAYAYVQGDATAPLQGIHGSAWSDLNVRVVDLVASTSARATRWLVVGAAPDTSSMAESVAQLRRERWAKMSGRILEDGSGSPLAGARVTIEDRNGNSVALAHSDQAGGYVLLAPPGDYRVRVDSPGRRAAGQLEVRLRESKDTTIDLLASRQGTVEITVTEGGKPSPAKITLVPLPGVAGAPVPRLFLGPIFASPAANVALTADGTLALAVPPGRYRAIASRGPEFSIHEREIDIQGGNRTRLELELKRVVDPGGYACIDLHQHASPSPDSGVTIADRLTSNLAEGLEWMVSSDHNVVVDYAAEVAQLKATRPLVVIPGNEATRDGIGHWNVYPVKPRPDLARGGALDVRGKNAHEIVSGLRTTNTDGEVVVQVNHPRAQPAFMAYFDTIRFDPTKPLPADWEGGFDAIEVFSSKDPSKADPLLRDWYALLLRGFTYTAVGGSDSHVIYPLEVGYPRTCVALGKDGKPSAAVLVDAIRHRRDVFITNGPFVRVSVGGRTMGQVAPATRGRARLDIEVAAAPWVDVRRVEIVVSGERRGKPTMIPQTPGKPLQWKGSIELKVDRDAFVVVMVRGDESLEPVIARLHDHPPPTALAITNPIYLDRDGDGKFTPQTKD